MTSTQYYTASSIDGFIADERHSLDWLFVNDIDPDGPQHYQGFITEVGAMCMGASTYQWLLDHLAETGEEWSYDFPCWVFTHRQFPPPSGDVRFVAGSPREVHPEMVAAAGEKNLWIVGGGGLAAQFYDAGLLDEVFVQWAPVSLGGGAPLLPRRIELTLEQLDRNRDFVCARYSVGRAPGPDAQSGS